MPRRSLLPPHCPAPALSCRRQGSSWPTRMRHTWPPQDLCTAASRGWLTLILTSRPRGTSAERPPDTYIHPSWVSLPPGGADIHHLPAFSSTPPGGSQRHLKLSLIFSPQPSAPREMATASSSPG